MQERQRLRAFRARHLRRARPAARCQRRVEPRLLRRFDRQQQFSEVALDQLLFQPRLLGRALDEPPPLAVPRQVEGVEVEVLAMLEAQGDFEHVQPVVFVQPAHAVLARPQLQNVVLANALKNRKLTRRRGDRGGFRSRFFFIPATGGSAFGGSSFFFSSYSS